MCQNETGRRQRLYVRRVTDANSPREMRQQNCAAGTTGRFHEKKDINATRYFASSENKRYVDRLFSTQSKASPPYTNSLQRVTPGFMNTKYFALVLGFCVGLFLPEVVQSSDEGPAIVKGKIGIQIVNEKRSVLAKKRNRITTEDKLQVIVSPEFNSYVYVINSNKKTAQLLNPKSQLQ